MRLRISSVLVQGLHLMIHNARQLHLSGLTNHAELVTTQIRRSLCRLSRGADEFTPRFGGSLAATDDDNSYAAPRLCYHLAHLATHIALEELDLIALKAGEVAAIETLDRWTSWMGHQAERARTIALHAGQIIRIVREYPTHGAHPSRLACGCEIQRELILDPVSRSHVRVFGTLLRRPLPLRLLSLAPNGPDHLDVRIAAGQRHSVPVRFGLAGCGRTRHRIVARARRTRVAVRLVADYLEQPREQWGLDPGAPERIAAPHAGGDDLEDWAGVCGGAG